MKTLSPAFAAFLSLALAQTVLADTIHVKLHMNGHTTEIKQSLPGAASIAQNATVKEIGPTHGSGNCVLTVKTIESTDDIKIFATVSGLDKGTVDVTVKEDEVSIRGSEAKSSTSNSGRGRGELVTAHDATSFERAFSLPASIDTSKAQAGLNGGQITLYLPKKDLKNGESM